MHNMCGDLFLFTLDLEDSDLITQESGEHVISLETNGFEEMSSKYVGIQTW